MPRLTLQRLDYQRSGSLAIFLCDRCNDAFDGPLLGIKFVEHLSCLEVEIHCTSYSTDTYISLVEGPRQDSACTLRVKPQLRNTTPDVQNVEPALPWSV